MRLCGPLRVAGQGGSDAWPEAVGCRAGGQDAWHEHAPHEASHGGHVEETGDGAAGIYG